MIGTPAFAIVFLASQHRTTTFSFSLVNSRYTLSSFVGRAKKFMMRYRPEERLRHIRGIQFGNCAHCNPGHGEGSAPSLPWLRTFRIDHMNLLIDTNTIDYFFECVAARLRAQQQFNVVNPRAVHRVLLPFLQYTKTHFAVCTYQNTVILLNRR